MSLRDLYQEIIVDHGKNPRRFCELKNANHIKLGHNPLCGDKLTLFVEEKDGKVIDASFQGSGCAISMASASLMLESVIGKSVTDVTKLFENFHVLVTEGREAEDDIGKLAVFSGVSEFPARVKCATLSWHTLMAALADDINIVSTES